MTSLAAPLPHNAHSVPKLSPHHHAPITTQSHNSSMVTLPRLRIPTDSEIMSAQQQQQWPVAAAAAQYQQQQPQQVQVPQQQQHAAMPMKAAAGPLTRSPSSPAAFFEDPDNKFGLTHLLEAAEQCLPVPVRPINNNNMFQHQEQTLPASLRKRSFSEREPVQQLQPQPQPQFYTQQQPQQQQPPYQFQQQLPSMAQHKMPSLGYLVSEEDRSYKRARPELSFNSFPASQSPSMSGFQHFQHQQSLSQSQSHYQQQQSPSYNTQAPAQMYRSPVLSGMHGMVSPIGSSGSCSPSTGVPMPSMIWETVIASGKFPSDVCLSENGQSSANKSGDAGSGSSSTASSDNPVKQGRWTCDEKEFAEALIQSVRNGDAVLPPNVSLRKFIADSLQCKAMRVSKKFRSLRACQSPTQGGGEGISPTDLDDASHSHKSFNPLSLSSIMNNEAAVEYESAMQQQHMSTPVSAASSHESQSNSNMGGLGKKPQRVLKRSDYSQHGVVRSGRWSLEEENYAKAMIEAFKNGYLPLHGNVSLRKFLSEVLVCHPMRISKKFVGYVRKYHWYRIAAGKCDPEAKQKALEELSQLERAFWASMQQSNDWALAAQDE